MLKDNDNDGKVNEDRPDDLNGDGYYTQFRYKNPKGNYFMDEVDPRLMIRLRRGEKTDKEKWSVIREDYDNDNAIKLIEGNFRFKSPISFQTPLARFNPKSSNFNIKLEEDLTTVIVFEEEVKLTSNEDEDTVKAGQSTTMNKKGKIKKPQDMKEIPVQAAPKMVEVPFRVYK